MNTNTVAQSDYAANAYTENVQQTTKKSAVTNGKTIGDAVERKGSKYYEQLRKKFSIWILFWSVLTKEEAQANAAQYANANHTVVLIDTDKIEKMAEDEAYRKKYEGIISGAQTQLARIKNGLGSNASHVKGYGIKINDNGTASLFAVIDKSLAAQKERIAKNAKTRAEEKKAAEKKADKKKTEEKQELKNDRSKRRRKKDYVTVTASSVEELLKKINDTIYDSMSDRVKDTAGTALGSAYQFFCIKNSFSICYPKKKEGYRMAKRKETECAVGNRQDEEEILKTYQTEDYDYLANSATGMDCTGLMHRTPSNENEMESYQEVYQYLPPNVRVDAMDGKDSHK